TPASATVIEPAPTAGLPAASPAPPAEARGAAAASQATQASATVALAAAAPAAAAPVVAPEAGGDDEAPAAIASGIIVFRTKSPSWVEVTDAKGVVALRRVMGAGEAEGVSGALPLQVVIGRVDAIEVQVRGKPFDLRPVSRDNVARFQVK
ncbi:MAG: DUF4115 domain-containing protein, partial [Ramlibacter sp.]|nr:DUF4115 domain-containing protein [Ramlibacter sp.]